MALAEGPAPHQLAFTAPLVSFEPISPFELNRCLVAWGHRMGPLERPMARPLCHALLHEGAAVAVTAMSTLIPAHLAGLTREDTCELSRLCAARPGLCRVALRLWREFVLPATGYRYAISYQHEGWHDGGTYRHDGWRVLTRTRSGTDQRSGRTGYSKTVWYWDTAWSRS